MAFQYKAKHLFNTYCSKSLDIKVSMTARPQDRKTISLR